MDQLTRFELTRLMGARALQLALGAPALVKVSKEDTVLVVAQKEIQKKVLPLTVLRKYPNGELKRLSA
jgi:DNA-directed RNA polymerase subunit K/omega